MKTPNSTESQQREAIEWLLTLERPECTESERQAFQVWLAESQNRQHLYWQVSQVWEKLGRLKGQEFPLRQEALKARSAKRRLQKSSRMAVAASILLGLGYGTFSSQGWYGLQQSYRTQRGQQQSLQLADGSTIELSTDSEVQVCFNYWQRKVELVRGEAFFSVMHDATRPFVVRVANGAITDIGTRFDVRRTDNTVEVAVEEGSVRIDTVLSKTLTASQILAYDRQGQFMPAENTSTEQLTAWRKGQLIFQNQPLDKVLAELERFHDIHLSLASPSLAKLKVSGTFHTDNLDNTLNVVTLTLPVEIRRLSAGEVQLARR